MILNVITRTHRENYFKVCRDSVESQTYLGVNLIVGSDRECLYYPDSIKLIKDYRQPLDIPHGHYFAPHNLYLNTLAEYVKSGWVMYLDDDDKFTSPKSAHRIMAACQDEDTMVVWKVSITRQWIVPSQTFGHYIMAGDFSGIGFAFHSKHLPVDWGRLSYGDYRVAWQLQQKGLKIKWVDMVLTQTQNGANNGS